MNNHVPTVEELMRKPSSELQAIFQNALNRASEANLSGRRPRGCEADPGTPGNLPQAASRTAALTPSREVATYGSLPLPISGDDRRRSQ